jgi:hypothetical protein
MTIHEPSTLLTDYLVSVAAVIFGARLWSSFRLWSLAFLGTAAGAFFGGTYHGFAAEMTPFAAAMLWKAAIFSIALASFFLLAGCGRAFAVIAVLKLIVTMSWMIGHDQFVWVILDYGITLLILGGAQIAGWFRHRLPSAPWALGSVALSVAGALVQQAQINLHAYFNHNDLYHVIQLVALWMLYRAGLVWSAVAPSHRFPSRASSDALE